MTTRLELLEALHLRIPRGSACIVFILPQELLSRKSTSVVCSSIICSEGSQNSILSTVVTNSDSNWHDLHPNMYMNVLCKQKEIVLCRPLIFQKYWVDNMNLITVTMGLYNVYKFRACY
eukprot:gb/GECG01016628.1/.p1 GENE.gb/GECG01016628.1/~~gb/GECG01016628.1/.p1  ORF type:complete len:119 (+),score=4.02 gb/GECG01016628.1/:1-357(+)